MNTRLSTKRRLMRWLIGALALALPVLWWSNRSLPPFGGGEPESVAARNLKAKVYASISPTEEADFSRLDTQNPGSWLLVFKETLQPLDVYQNSDPIRPTSARRTIVIQPLQPISAEQTRMLPTLRRRVFSFPFASRRRLLSHCPQPRCVVALRLAAAMVINAMRA